jgi:phosphoserine phosphatase
MSERGKMMSLSAIGLDSPGLVSKITSRIFEMRGNIIDVEESCRRGLFSIFLIVDFSISPHSWPEIAKAMSEIGDETGLKVIAGVYDEAELSYFGKKENHVVTILGEDQPGIIARVSTFFHKYNINIESCRMIAQGKFFSMEMAIDTNRMNIEHGLSRNEAIDRMKGELKDLCRSLNQSVVIQSENIYMKNKKLVVFDVESTLIQEGSLRDFLEGIRGKVTFVDYDATSGDEEENELQVLIRNARLLKGTPMRDFERFGEILQLNPGALELISILKSMGFKIALLSSGFNFFIKKIFEAAGVDYAFSNSLRTDDRGIITGELQEPVITSASKSEILEFIMNVENIQPEQVIAVGDGSTGTHFIRNVGLSIAFKPNEKSIETDGILASGQILNILYCLGIPRTELDKHLKNDSGQPVSAESL